MLDVFVLFNSFRIFRNFDQSFKDRATATWTGHNAQRYTKSFLKQETKNCQKYFIIPDRIACR